MVKIRTDQPVLPSLLDRLIDNDPRNRQESAISRSHGVVLRDIKNSIRRDLEWLLNTRVYRSEPPAGLTELDVSIVNYGLPDFSVIHLGSDEGKQEFRQRVSDAIEKYEPRFRNVDVELEQIGEEYERTLYMKISAVLMIEPDPIPLLFDSRVKALDKAVRLREINHG